MISLEDIKQELPSRKDLPSLPDLPSVHDVTEFVSRLDPRTRRRRRRVSTTTAVLAGVALAVVAGIVAALLLRRDRNADTDRQPSPQRGSTDSVARDGSVSRPIRSA